MVHKYSEIEIVLPVYNEQKILEENALQIKNILERENFGFKISIVDNGSTDQTFKIAKGLQGRFANISAFRLGQKGRGGALKFRILNSPSSVIGYMDIDLSTDPVNFLRMYYQLNQGYDIIIGSRQLLSSVVKRSCLRRLLSRVYSRMVRTSLDLPFFDYQCGFKLFRRDKILSLIPLIKNNNWFFDTELIFYAHKQGLRIKEFGIDWQESKRKSKVNLFSAIFEDIKSILYLSKVQRGQG